MTSRALLTSLAALLLAALAGGCASVQPAAALEMAAPTVEPEPAAAPEPTLLERYQQSCKLQLAEKERADAFEAQLTDEKKARAVAEADAHDQHRLNETLAVKTAEFDSIGARYSESQKTCLELESSVRDLRRELLQEKLANSKNEQTILSMKIERAMERRHTALDKPLAAAQDGTDKSSPTAPKTSEGPQ